MKNYYLGIDIGTSAAKLLLATTAGETLCVKSEYQTNDISGWCHAIKQGLAELSRAVHLSSVCAVSVSAQVGTYITDKNNIVPWYSHAGECELKQIRSECSEDYFIKEIGMQHPELISFPLPRLMYIQRNFNDIASVIMPKEAIVYDLTECLVTDVFSQRGIAHPEKKEYSQEILTRFHINFRLPKILHPTDLAGLITERASKMYGLSAGTPVYVGCNDFYAGLLGMGVFKENTVFELSGTSEHIGVITKERMSGQMISGKYFNGYATYGGTKSSGVSCDFAIKQFGVDGFNEGFSITDQPIFLPYLRGERAPIYHENARGVFFGITDQTTKRDMAYAVLEGVVFSLYHIGESLPISGISTMITSGGSAKDKLMARLKADLFDSEILCAKENNASALGAAIIAMVGDQAFDSLEQAVSSVVRYTSVAKPDGSLRAKLLTRFEIYKNLYISLKDQFDAFAKI